VTHINKYCDEKKSVGREGRIGCVYILYMKEAINACKTSVGKHEGKESVWGWLEYSHSSPRSSKRQRKWNP
jgi:hypothetical protein